MNKYAQMADRLYDQEQQMKRLEKENAELDCQKNRNKACYSCANATERCFRNEIACPCQKYKSYKEENAELKKQIEKMKCCENCAKRGHICVAEEMQGNLCGKNKVKWELRR